MTVVLIEGFDHCTAAQLGTYKSWQGTAFGSVQTGRISGQCVRPQGGGSVTYRSLPASYTTAICGVALQFVTSQSPDVTAIALRASGTVVASLRSTLVGGNYVWRIVNSASTTLATGTLPISVNTWYYVEMKVLVSATVGTVELRVNGAATAECSATVVNTGASNIDNVWIAAPSNAVSFDDLYVVDTTTGASPTDTFLGDVRVETIMPTANGTATAWTGVYTDVNEATTVNDDTNYISSSTPGDRETYALADLSVATGTVLAVQTNLIARKDDAGTRTIAPVIRTGGVDYDGTTAAALSTSYAGYRQLYDRLDPVGNTWSIATVNGMEAGVKEVT